MRVGSKRGTDSVRRAYEESAKKSGGVVTRGGHALGSFDGLARRGRPDVRPSGPGAKAVPPTF